LAGLADLVGAFLPGTPGARVWSIVKAVVTLAAGIFLVANPKVSLGFIVLIAVLWLLGYGLVLIVEAMRLRSSRAHGASADVPGLVIFAHAFYVLDINNPSEVAGLHTRLDSLYFVMNTLTTVGTGDVHAAGQVARALVLVQMVFNVVFVATTATLLTTRIRQK